MGLVRRSGVARDAPEERPHPLVMLTPRVPDASMMGQLSLLRSLSLRDLGLCWHGTTHGQQQQRTSIAEILEHLPRLEFLDVSMNDIPLLRMRDIPSTLTWLSATRCGVKAIEELPRGMAVDAAALLGEDGDPHQRSPARGDAGEPLLHVNSLENSFSTPLDTASPPASSLEVLTICGNRLRGHLSALASLPRLLTADVSHNDLSSLDVPPSLRCLRADGNASLGRSGLWDCITVGVSVAAAFGDSGNGSNGNNGRDGRNGGGHRIDDRDRDRDDGDGRRHGRVGAAAPREPLPLRELHLNRCGVTAVPWDTLARDLPSVVELGLRENGIVDAPGRDWRGAPRSLRTIDLRGNRLAAAVVVARHRSVIEDEGDSGRGAAVSAPRSSSSSSSSAASFRVPRSVRPPRDAERGTRFTGAADDTLDPRLDDAQIGGGAGGGGGGGGGEDTVFEAGGGGPGTRITRVIRVYLAVDDPALLRDIRAHAIPAAERDIAASAGPLDDPVRLVAVEPPADLLSKNGDATNAKGDGKGSAAAHRFSELTAALLAHGEKRPWLVSVRGPAAGGNDGGNDRRISAPLIPFGALLPAPRRHDWREGWARLEVPISAHNLALMDYAAGLPVDVDDDDEGDGDDDFSDEDLVTGRSGASTMDTSRARLFMYRAAADEIDADGSGGQRGQRDGAKVDPSVLRAMAVDAAVDAAAVETSRRAARGYENRETLLESIRSDIARAVAAERSALLGSGSGLSQSMRIRVLGDAAADQAQRELKAILRAGNPPVAISDRFPSTGFVDAVVDNVRVALGAAGGDHLRPGATNSSHQTVRAGPRLVLIRGNSGSGKSCALARVLSRLMSRGMLPEGTSIVPLTAPPPLAPPTLPPRSLLESWVNLALPRATGSVGVDNDGTGRDPARVVAVVDDIDRCGGAVRQWLSMLGSDAVVLATGEHCEAWDGVVDAHDLTGVDDIILARDLVATILGDRAADTNDRSGSRNGNRSGSRPAIHAGRVGVESIAMGLTSRGDDVGFVGIGAVRLIVERAVLAAERFAGSGTVFSEGRLALKSPPDTAAAIVEWAKELAAKHGLAPVTAVIATIAATPGGVNRAEIEDAVRESGGRATLGVDALVSDIRRVACRGRAGLVVMDGAAVDEAAALILSGALDPGHGDRSRRSAPRHLTRGAGAFHAHLGEQHAQRIHRGSTIPVYTPRVVSLALYHAAVAARFSTGLGGQREAGLLMRLLTDHTCAAALMDCAPVNTPAWVPRVETGAWLAVAGVGDCAGTGGAASFATEARRVWARVASTLPRFGYMDSAPLRGGDRRSAALRCVLQTAVLTLPEGTAARESALDLAAAERISGEPCVSVLDPGTGVNPLRASHAGSGSTAAAAAAALDASCTEGTAVLACSIAGHASSGLAVVVSTWGSVRNNQKQQQQQQQQQQRPFAVVHDVSLGIPCGNLIPLPSPARAVSVVPVADGTDRDADEQGQAFASCIGCDCGAVVGIDIDLGTEIASGDAVRVAWVSAFPVVASERIDSYDGTLAAPAPAASAASLSQSLSRMSLQGQSQSPGQRQRQRQCHPVVSVAPLPGGGAIAQGGPQGDTLARFDPDGRVVWHMGGFAGVTIPGHQGALYRDHRYLVAVRPVRATPENSLPPHQRRQRGDEPGIPAVLLVSLDDGAVAAVLPLEDDDKWGNDRSDRGGSNGEPAVATVASALRHPGHGVFALHRGRCLVWSDPLRSEPGALPDRSWEAIRDRTHEAAVPLGDAHSLLAWDPRGSQLCISDVATGRVQRTFPSVTANPRGSASSPAPCVAVTDAAIDESVGVAVAAFGNRIVAWGIGAAGRVVSVATGRPASGSRRVTSASSSSSTRSLSSPSTATTSSGPSCPPVTAYTCPGSRHMWAEPDGGGVNGNGCGIGGASFSSSSSSSSSCPSPFLSASSSLRAGVTGPMQSSIALVQRSPTASTGSRPSRSKTSSRDDGPPLRVVKLSVPGGPDGLGHVVGMRLATLAVRGDEESDIDAAATPTSPSQSQSQSQVPSSLLTPRKGAGTASPRGGVKGKRASAASSSPRGKTGSKPASPRGTKGKSGSQAAAAAAAAEEEQRLARAAEQEKRARRLRASRVVYVPVVALFAVRGCGLFSAETGQPICVRAYDASELGRGAGAGRDDNDKHGSLGGDVSADAETIAYHAGDGAVRVLAVTSARRSGGVVNQSRGAGSNGDNLNDLAGVSITADITLAAVLHASSAVSGPPGVEGGTTRERGGLIIAPITAGRRGQVDLAVWRAAASEMPDPPRHAPTKSGTGETGMPNITCASDDLISPPQSPHPATTQRSSASQAAQSPRAAASGRRTASGASKKKPDPSPSRKGVKSGSKSPRTQAAGRKGTDRNKRGSSGSNNNNNNNKDKIGSARRGAGGAGDPPTDDDGPDGNNNNNNRNDDGSDAASSLSSSSSTADDRSNHHRTRGGRVGGLTINLGVDAERTRWLASLRRAWSNPPRLVRIPTARTVPETRVKRCGVDDTAGPWVVLGDPTHVSCALGLRFQQGGGADVTWRIDAASLGEGVTDMRVLPGCTGIAVTVRGETVVAKLVSG